MKIFSGVDLAQLTQQARSAPRRRQHCNIHQHYDEHCQRLFNAIEPDSYIRPHRHAQVPREELLMAVRGLMALLTFDEQGGIDSVIHFGSELHGSNMAVGVEVPPGTWHTVLALKPGAILLEVKAGPFDLQQPKDFAPWAPEESSPQADQYLAHLMQLCQPG